MGSNPAAPTIFLATLSSGIPRSALRAVRSARKWSTGPFFLAPHFTNRIDWWERLKCSCNIGTRDRAVLETLLSTLGESPYIYHVGHFDRSRRWLSEKSLNMVDSQFEDGRPPGYVDEKGIRYEDVTKLTFEDAIFSHIICAEVLEHVPDYRAALKEFARVLRPGGKAILTLPWSGKDRYDHLVRAEMLADGTIHHILPPEYHGDTAADNGILSFRTFSWQILDEVRDLGFSDARAQYKFDPLHGHMTLGSPVIVGTR